MDGGSESCARNALLKRKSSVKSGFVACLFPIHVITISLQELLEGDKPLSFHPTISEFAQKLSVTKAENEKSVSGASLVHVRLQAGCCACVQAR